MPTITERITVSICAQITPLILEMNTQTLKLASGRSAVAIDQSRRDAHLGQSTSAATAYPTAAKAVPADHRRRRMQRHPGR